MSIAMGSPIEALALNYLSFGFLTVVNSIWTWVAVLVGAASFLISFRKLSVSIPGFVSLGPEIQPLGLVPGPDASADALVQSQSPEVALEMSDWTTRKKSIPSSVSPGPEIQHLGLACEPDASTDVLVQAPRVAPEVCDWTTRKKSIPGPISPDPEIQPLGLVPEPDALTLTQSPGISLEVSDWTTRKNFIPDPISPGLEMNHLGLVPEPDASADALAQSPGVRSEVSDWTTGKKFTVYYEDDDVAKARNIGKAWNKINETSLNRVIRELEGMIRMRILNGDEMGWYRYQDLTVINGNIVRLWESN